MTLLFLLKRASLLRGSSLSRLASTTATTPPPVEVFVNGNPVSIPAGSAVIQACELAGVDIPRFCYHERLAVAGNCRMCLVEVEKVPKAVASCAMPVTPGMKIKTDSPMVKKAREGVMEFLLANHPLDCPICDQGGECDLQDQSVRYGSDRSRFNEPIGKRAVENKNLGPLVKTVMTRCIQCTRCVRFANDVAGAVELGTSGRGNDMQIGTYVEKTLSSELSGNIIDLCPVGALTSKPYAFTSRPWELKKTESVDVLDAVGSNIRIDSRGLEVMRVLPRVNDDVNEEWISDKTRFAYDGLKTQRLTVPMIRRGTLFEPATWEEALQAIAVAAKQVNPEEMVGIGGALADAESLVALKDFMNSMGSENLVVESVAPTLAPGSFDFRSNYVFNTSIPGIEEADALLLIGTNPRHEAAVLNARIRKAYLAGLDVGVIGETPTTSELNYDFEHLGTDPSTIESLAKGNSKSEFMKMLKSAKKPMVIVGSAVFERDDVSAVLASVAGLVQSLSTKTVDPSWKIYNVLQRTAGSTAALDIGYSQVAPSQVAPKFIYLLNSDDLPASRIPKNAFVVYQGHHGDAGASFADVILPGAAYTEKTATYVNTEGRAQLSRSAVSPPAGTREDWKILRALSQVCGVPLKYDEISELRVRMHHVSPTLVDFDRLLPTSTLGLGLAALKTAGAGKKLGSAPFTLPIQDFYQTDPISRASRTMAKCSTAFTKGEELEPESAVFQAT